MKRTLPAIVCLLIGFGLGWTLCYFGPVAQHQRKVLAEYYQVRDEFQLSDAEMAEFGRNVRQYGKDLIREDELAAIVSLSVFKIAEKLTPRKLDCSRQSACTIACTMKRMVTRLC